MAIAALKSFQKNVTTAGTAVPLVATKTFAVGLVITAKAGNTDKIFMGALGVLPTTGHVLAASAEVKLTDILPDKLMSIDISQIYIDSVVNGEGVSGYYVELSQV